MPASKRYKMVRIPEEEYEELRAARRELIKRGTRSLPREVVYDDDDQNDDEEEEDSSLTNGFILGLGAAALMYLLTKDDKK